MSAHYTSERETANLRSCNITTMDKEDAVSVCVGILEVDASIYIQIGLTKGKSVKSMLTIYTYGNTE